MGAFCGFSFLVQARREVLTKNSSMSFFVLLMHLIQQTFASIHASAEYLVFFAYSVSQCLVGTTVGFLLFRNRERNKGEHLAGATVGVNLGTFAYPLVFAVFGEVGLRRAVVFDFFNQVSILIASYVLFALSTRRDGDGGEKTTKEVILKAIKTQMFTPCLLALYLSIALKAIPNASIPYALDQFLGSLAVAAKPLALLSLGILFEPKMSKSEVSDVVTLLLIRYGSGLLIAATAIALNMYQFIGASGLAVLTLALTAPVPLISIRYAKQFGLNSGPAATAVNASNVVSFVAILMLAGADFETQRRSLMSLFALIGFFLFSVGCFMNKKAMMVSEEGNDDSFEIRDIGNGKKRFVSTNAFLTRRRANTIAITKFDDTNHHIYKRRKNVVQLVPSSLSPVATPPPRVCCRTFVVSRRIRNRNSDRFFCVAAHRSAALVF